MPATLSPAIATSTAADRSIRIRHQHLPTFNNKVVPAGIVRTLHSSALTASMLSAHFRGVLELMRSHLSPVGETTDSLIYRGSYHYMTKQPQRADVVFADRRRHKAVSPYVTRPNHKRSTESLK